MNGFVFDHAQDLLSWRILWTFPFMAFGGYAYGWALKNKKFADIGYYATIGIFVQIVMTIVFPSWVGSVIHHIGKFDPTTLTQLTYILFLTAVIVGYLTSANKSLEV